MTSQHQTQTTGKAGDNKPKQQPTIEQTPELFTDWLSSVAILQRTLADTRSLTPVGAAQLQRTLGNQAIRQIAALTNDGQHRIQRYHEHLTKSGNYYRKANDGSMIVKQENIYGSQRLWALPGKATAASKLLKTAKSVIRLEEVGPAKKFKLGTKWLSLAPIEPQNVSTMTSGTGSGGMKLWADCGKSARDVIGVGGGTGGGIPKAVYTDPTGTLQETAASSNPATLKREIMLTYILYIEKTTGKAICDQAKLQKFVVQRDKATAAYSTAEAAGKDKVTLDDLAAKYGYWDEEITNLIVNCYTNNLTTKQRTAFDKQAGINQWADPTVGQGYTISTGGLAKPGQEKSTWNFHWAGVVMTSNDGADKVTLENYAVGDASVQNREWVFQLYGSAKAAEIDPAKKGQTFHEQHRDVHGQHGQMPTTMSVKPR